MAVKSFCFNLAGAMSEWPDVAFSRVWRVGNKYLGVTKTGVYELTGNTDNGTDFTSTITTSKNTLKKNALKRIPMVRINCLGTGTARCDMDENTSSGNVEFTEAERIKFGRGMKGRTVSLTISSTTADFNLQSIEIFEEVLQRGVN